jgi:hypothetical protein
VTPGPGPSLLPAVELVSAWTHAADDAEFYWRAVERVMADITSPTAKPEALAELVFGLSSLGGILLDQLAATRGSDAVAVLAAIHTAHIGGAAPPGK